MGVGKSFCIIDCGYHFRASFFVLPPMFARDGRLVNAVYGFVSVLLKLVTRYRPSALAVAGDAPGPYFRHKMFPAYKSEKTRVPEECDRQMPILRQVLNALAIPYVSTEGFEADDVMATLSRAAQAEGYRVYLCSRDKDLLQLLSGAVTVLNITSGEEMTAETLKERRGIRPEQVPDAIALAGDKADSIPGVPGIGWKTAASLLAVYSTVENALEHWQDMSSNLGNKIHEHRDQVLLAKRLATLRTDVPIPVRPEAYELRLADRSRLEPLFRELGFERLLERLERLRDIESQGLWAL
jgi:DNA polymerase-1